MQAFITDPLVAISLKTLQLAMGAVLLKCIQSMKHHARRRVLRQRRSFLRHRRASAEAQLQAVLRANSDDGVDAINNNKIFCDDTGRTSPEVKQLKGRLKLIQKQEQIVLDEVINLQKPKPRSITRSKTPLPQKVRQLDQEEPRPAPTDQNWIVQNDQDR